MEAITMQEALNKVWQYFVVDGNPQARVQGSCQYRTLEGCKCAFGVLIPDDKYHDAMEGCTVSMLSIKARPVKLQSENTKPLMDYLDDVLDINNPIMARFYSELQRAHDNYRHDMSSLTFKDHIRARLQQVAELHKLTVPTG